MMKKNTMTRVMTAAMAAMVAAMAMTGCGGSTASSAAPEEKKTLLIGGSGPLTGDYATYGISVKQGAELAAKEINAAGGVNGYEFVVQVEDDQADPAMAVNAYASLMDSGMKVSLGATTSGACIAVSEETQKDGLLMLTPSGSQKECTQYDNGFRVCFTDPDQGTYAADYMVEKQLAKKVAILYDKSNDYSAGITKSFLAQAAAKGLEVVTEQAFTDQSNTDFSVQLQAIKSSGAELLFLPIYAQEAAYVLTQAEKLDLDVITFGCDGLDGILTKIGEEKKSATEGVMLLTPFAADATDEVTVKFVTAYQEAFHAIPDQFAADAYDAVYTIKAAMEQAATEPSAEDFDAKMIAAMTEIEVVGTTGTMSWTADGEPVKSATAVVIKDGGYVAYGA